MRAQHLLFPASLPHLNQKESLSVMSYNVLLPNSSDGWWNYKMYHPPLPPGKEHVSTWEHRRELLKERIGLIDSDVVCLQEVSPLTFETDFAFMKEELGYDGVELFRKNRFRPATFWRKKKCQLVSEPMHRDRCLLTSFRLEGGVENWHVLNCHLQAGNQAKRRLRQVLDGVGTVVKQARKLKEEDPSSPLLVVCGDFNGDEGCGAVRVLEDGCIDPSFEEGGESVTSKPKQIPLSSPLLDVSATLDRQPPPTLVVSEQISLLVGPTSSCALPLSQLATDALRRIYANLATHQYQNQPCMNLSDVERWLVAINGKVGRGTEFRNAAREMGWTSPDPEARIHLPAHGRLSEESFLKVYQAELSAGKFWGIAHDIAVLKELLPDKGVFSARFDRIYCSKALRPVAVLDVTSAVACPNEVEPSDHLPVAATLCLHEERSSNI